MSIHGDDGFVIVFHKASPSVAHTILLNYLCTLSLSSPPVSFLSLFFEQFDGCVYIAVSGDGQESDGVLMKKLYLFNKLLHFLYGPLLTK